jgi:ATP phosphoribosyltransferase
MQTLKLLIPKGRIFDNVSRLFEDAGFPLELSDRTYRPRVGAEWMDVKIMKPQNVGELLEMGSHDAGFTGADWIAESSADVAEVLDLGMDKVKIVAAVPATCAESPAAMEALKARKVVVATEYVHIAERWLKKEAYNYHILRTYGATEVFPPDDADIIIDNSASGKTLRDNGLAVIASLLESSTRFVASKAALRDPWKKEKIDKLAMLFKAVLDGRERVMLEMNVSKDKFPVLVKTLPSMRSPTVSPLYGDSGFAVKVAVKRDEVAGLIPELKRLGATDIVEYELRKVAP